jgi:hypothetical protein
MSLLLLCYISLLSTGKDWQVQSYRSNYTCQDTPRGAGRRGRPAVWRKRGALANNCRYSPQVFPHRSNYTCEQNTVVIYLQADKPLFPPSFVYIIPPEELSAPTTEHKALLEDQQSKGKEVIN